MNVTGAWRIVSSPDFDDDYLRMDVDPYVELTQSGNRCPAIASVSARAEQSRKCTGVYGASAPADEASSIGRCQNAGSWLWLIAAICG